MFVSQKTILFLSGAVATLSLSACNGIFENIYDKPTTEGKDDFGFVYVDDQTNIGRIYINATDYGQWHYIDFSNKEVIAQKVAGQTPAEWDFAIHRYDTKTNGGGVIETNATDFNSIPQISNIPEDALVSDEWTTDKITVDMSQMMDGVIIYAEDYYNPCLSKWLNVDTSSMPPVYTLSGKIYLLRLSDDSYATIRLGNYMNNAGVKGFMTIDYQYPIQQ